MTDLVILVPMLHRAHRVAPLLDSINAATPAARVLFLCTRNDSAVLAAVADHEHLVFPPAGRGDYQRKINAGYQATTEPFIFLAADDLHFHPGWKAAAVSELTDGIGVVGTNDLGSPRVIAGEHATHCLVTRDYVDHHGTIDEPHKILHEGYPHEFCDDELVGTAKHRNAWAFAEDAHVEHLHPNWGKAPSDDLYAAQHTRIRVGRRIYQRRRRLWT